MAKRISGSSPRRAAASSIRTSVSVLEMLIVPRVHDDEPSASPNRRATGLSLGSGRRKSVSTQFGMTEIFDEGTPLAEGFF